MYIFKRLSALSHAIPVLLSDNTPPRD